MFSYPGIGRALVQADYNGINNQPEPHNPDPSVTTIATTKYSMYEAIGSAYKATLTVLYATTSGTALTVQVSPDPTFTTHVQDIDTIDISTGTMATWVATVPIQGCLRVYNGSGQTMDALYVQKVECLWG